MSGSVKVPASEFLAAAAATIRARGDTYDPVKGEERSMARIVELFNLKTGRKLTETEGWLFMMCLKEVRFATAPSFHYDSVIDMLAYGALMAEAAKAAEEEELIAIGLD